MIHSNPFRLTHLSIKAFLLSAILMGNTFAQVADPAEKGERIYGNYCMTCHGESLINSGQSFDLRKLKVTEKARFENSVQNGKNQMPPWKGVISTSDMQYIWAYIRTLANDKDQVTNE
jgi:mono/diheme cytochrome c family protein